MKEKDIIDFSKMEEDENGFFTDEDGNEIDCEICYTHKKAFDILTKKQVDSKGRVLPLCPKCGNVLSKLSGGYYYGTVSEVNYPNPDGEIGLYEFYHCDTCDADPRLGNQNNYALMPIRIVYNANHDIHYTGGRDYDAKDEDIEKLIDDVFKRIKGSIQQYIKRRLNPKDKRDKELDINNVMLWSKNGVEHAICNWLYERGLKK